MKRLLLLSTITLLALGGCKSHKQEAVVNAVPSLEETDTWQLTKMRGKKIDYAESQQPVSLKFNPEAGTISGRSGCNRYFGTYAATSSNLMTFGEVGSTRMACPDSFMRLERQYLQSLSKVDHYELGEYGLLLLQGETVLLEFEKMNPELTPAENE